MITEGSILTIEIGRQIGTVVIDGAKGAAASACGSEQREGITCGTCRRVGISASRDTERPVERTTAGHLDLIMTLGFACTRSSFNLDCDGSTCTVIQVAIDRKNSRTVARGDGACIVDIAANGATSGDRPL